MSSRGPGIRETVKVLLDLLRDCGCPHVPSESFRLAKFDQPQALEPFWRLLHHLLSVHLLLGSGDLSDLREAGKDCCGSSEINHVSLCVRKRARDLGYVRVGLYVDGMGSRELLLFFGWLLQSMSLVRQLQRYHVRSALDSMSVPLSPSKQFLLEHIETRTASLGRELESLSCAGGGSLEDTLRRIQWIRGTLLGTGRAAENTHKAAAKVSHTLLQLCAAGSSAKSSRAHRLSLHDVFFARYPEQLEARVQRLEWHVGCLEGVRKWGQHRQVFWQWMESVLDLQYSSEADREGEGDGVEGLKEEVYQCQLKLSSAIGDCLSRVGAGRESSRNSKKQERKSHSLQRVAVECSVLCSTEGYTAAAVSSGCGLVDERRSVANGGCCLVDQRLVEGEVKTLKARVMEEEKILCSLQTTIAAHITKCHTSI